jgi:hypothetical protein
LEVEGFKENKTDTNSLFKVKESASEIRLADFMTWTLNSGFSLLDPDTEEADAIRGEDEVRKHMGLTKTVLLRGFIRRLLR